MAFHLATVDEFDVFHAVEHVAEDLSAIVALNCLNPDVGEG